MTLRAKTLRRESSVKETVLRAATEEDTCRINAEIPKSLHRRVKIFAAEKDKSITELLVSALNEYLSKYSAE